MHLYNCQKRFCIEPSVTYGHTQKKCDMHIYIHLKRQTTLSRKRNGLDLCEGGEKHWKLIIVFVFLYYSYIAVSDKTKHGLVKRKCNTIPGMEY